MVTLGARWSSTVSVISLDGELNPRVSVADARSKMVEPTAALTGTEKLKIASAEGVAAMLFDPAGFFGF